MNAPVIVIHTLVPSLENSQITSYDHTSLDYQITEEGNICKGNEKTLHLHVSPAAIHIGFHCKARGGTLTEAQYHTGLNLILEIAAHYNTPLTRSSILSHYEIDTQHPHSCPGPFFPWARLMIDLQSPYPFVSIYRDGSPISIGYLRMGTTYAPVRKVAEALGYNVRWDSIQNRIVLKRDM
jgi:hypothetical protein